MTQTDRPEHRRAVQQQYKYNPLVLNMHPMIYHLPKQGGNVCLISKAKA